MQPAALWVTSNTGGKVFKVDPASGDILLEVEVGTGAAGVALGAGSAWVVIGPAAEVVRVNAETGDIEARIAVGTDPEGVAFLRRLRLGQCLHIGHRGLRSTRRPMP